jgi:hypothetical protein
MRRRIVLALFASVVLIGMASWSRFSGGEAEENSLAVVENNEGKETYYDKLVKDYLETSTTTTNVSPENLTGTDLIGRQLILDYVDLASRGQATEANLNALAEKYVESIPTLIVSKKLNYFDLKVMPNNKTDFKNYSAAIEKIYLDYISKMTEDSYDENMVGSENTALVLDIGNIYQETASVLQKLPVPAALVEAHLKLTNAYFENASAMNSVAGVDTDPASSFAGLIIVKNNLEKEEDALSKIREILAENGT